MKKLKTHQIERLSIEEYRQANKRNIIIWLDNIRSMNNIGSAFRTCDAFLVDQIILTGISARPPHNEIHKTALGAEETVNWQYFETNEEALQFLKGNEYKICALEQADRSLPLNEMKFKSNEKYCLVFGNEVFGVADEIIAQSDYCLEIPQFGTKHSLNVSVSIGIALWQYLQRG